MKKFIAVLSLVLVLVVPQLAVPQAVATNPTTIILVIVVPADHFTNFPSAQAAVNYIEPDAFGKGNMCCNCRRPIPGKAETEDLGILEVNHCRRSGGHCYGGAICR